MNSKLFLILFVVLLTLLTLGFYSKESKVELSNVPVPNIGSSDVDMIEIVNSKSKVVLKLIDKTWKVANDFEYKANISKINSLLLKLLSPQSLQHIPYSEQGLKKLVQNMEYAGFCFRSIT